MRNNTGTRTEPWGTPELNVKRSDWWPFMSTYCVLHDRYDLIEFTILLFIPSCLRLIARYGERYQRLLRSQGILHQSVFRYVWPLRSCEWFKQAALQFTVFTRSHVSWNVVLSCFSRYLYIDFDIMCSWRLQQTQVKLVDNFQ